MITPKSDTKLLTFIKRDLIKRFRAANLETPDLEARLIMMHVTGLTHLDLITAPSHILSSKNMSDIYALADRRLQGEPLDHIFGYKAFYGRQFCVSKDVLSPRPETEMLVSAALEIIKSNPEARLLDLGTGTGAIIISIIVEAPHTQGFAVDISSSALTIAAKNARMHKVEDRLIFAQGSWFNSVKGQFDIILSNPPYITDVAMESLDVSVKDYDPAIALKGGVDGLEAYRVILFEAQPYLNLLGTLVVEIGYDQGQAVAALFEEAGFGAIEIIKDLSGHDRVVSGVKWV